MAFTLNRRLSTLVDSSGQLNAGKISNDYITSDHIANNSLTTAMLHSGFTLPTSSLSSIDTDNLTEGSSNLYFTNARVDSRLSGGTGVTYSSGAISIGQAVATSSNVTFADLTVTGDLTITGDINSYNVTDLDVTDKTITIGKGQTESNSGGSGLIVDGSSASILWDETNDQFDFNKGINVDSNTLVVDGTNNRVGILNASPDVSLDLGSATDGIHMPVGTTGQRPSSPAAGYFRYNSTDGQFEGYTTEWGAIAGSGAAAMETNNFTGDGSTTAFTLSSTVASEDNLIVFIEGIYQNKGDYVASGTTITFTTAPVNSRRIVVQHILSSVSGNSTLYTSLTGNGSATAFTLSGAPGNENNTQVFMDGVYQQKDSYIVNGTTLTFDAAPANSAEIEVMSFTQTTINAPGSNTVTTSTIADDAVTSAKIAANAVGVTELNVSDGSNGQALTTNGSGTLSFATIASGPTFKTFGTSSIMLGDSTTGTIDAANYNTGVGVDVFAALTSGDGNTAVGFQTLAANTTGGKNSAFGQDALKLNTTGVDNTSIGFKSLDANTEGDSNTAVGKSAMGATTTGSNNVGLGAGALGALTTGSQNTAVGNSAGGGSTASNNTSVGYAAGTALTTGLNNIFVGSESGDAITTANNNVAIGHKALSVETAGNANTAVGYSALENQNHTGGGNSYNVAMGFKAGEATTTGTQNTFIGSNSGYTNSTGSYNVALGGEALKLSTTAAGNIAIGYSALYTNTTGHSNVAIGQDAAEANTDGHSNTVVGFQALKANTGGDFQVAIGIQALKAEATSGSNVAIGALSMMTSNGASNNVAVGKQTGYLHTNGDHNVWIGSNAGFNSTTGSGNCYMGYVAGYSCETGNNNVAIGKEALYANTGTENTAIGLLSGRYQGGNNYNTFYGSRAGYATTSSENVIIGAYGGSSNTSSYHHVIIGYNAQSNHASNSNTENVIGHGVTGIGSGYNTLGGNSNRTYNQQGSASWSGTSDSRLKTDVVNEPLGLAFINDLRPVKFKWKKKKDVNSSIFPTIFEDGSEERVQPTEHGVDKHGFLAQELESTIANYANAGDAGHEIFKQTTDGVYTASPSALIPMLVKALQEADDKIDALTEMQVSMTARIETLEG